MNYDAMPKIRKIILLLGDQLSGQMSSLEVGRQETDIVLMAEVATEASYVAHHKKKIAFLFSAMRHFAGELTAQGWAVRYVRYDDAGNSSSLIGEVECALRETGAQGVVMTEPGEYRLKAAFNEWAQTSQIAFDMVEDTRFIASHKTFQTWADGRKQLRMEYFYRDMRRKTGLLMDGDVPLSLIHI